MFIDDRSVNTDAAAEFGMSTFLFRENFLACLSLKPILNFSD